MTIYVATVAIDISKAASKSKGGKSSRLSKASNQTDNMSEVKIIMRFYTFMNN